MFCFVRCSFHCAESACRRAWLRRRCGAPAAPFVLMPHHSCSCLTIRAHASPFVLMPHRHLSFLSLLASDWYGGGAVPPKACAVRGRRRAWLPDRFLSCLVGGAAPSPHHSCHTAYIHAHASPPLVFLSFPFASFSLWRAIGTAVAPYLLRLALATTACGQSSRPATVCMSLSHG